MNDNSQAVGTGNNRGWLSKVIAVAIAVTAASQMTVDERQVHVAALLPAFEEYEIDTCERVAAAVAQFAHETGGYRWLKELGNASYLRRYQGYPGAGYIHLTWKSNYELMQKCTGLPIVKNPQLLQKPEVAARVSACWWNEHGLNRLADHRNMVAITRIINGGQNGFAERMQNYRIIMKAFSEQGICDR